MSAPTRGHDRADTPTFGSFADLRTADLVWSRGSVFGRLWTLEGGSATLATLERLSTFGHRYAARTADAAWSFDTPGFLGRRVVVRTAEGGDVAELKTNWRREGTLVLPNGHQYRWASASFWGRTWVFRDVGGSDLTFRMPWGGRRIEVDAPLMARRNPDLALLACTGAYLMALASRRRAAAAAGAGA